VLAKLCPDCGEWKLVEDFPANARRTDGRGTYCRDCNKARCRAAYERRRAAEGKVAKRQVPQPTDPRLRRCPDCERVQPLTAFPRSGSGRGTYCKPCHNARGKQSVASRGGSRHYHLTRRYGISATEVDALIEAQGGVCLICEERPAEHVDHDHATGAVRGILCFGCNGGLGQFRDRVDIMRNAIEYLEGHSG
jgi:hypothetical protein